MPLPPSTILKAGVAGWPIGHSLSPRLHGFWLRAYGIDGVYDALPIEPQGLPGFLRGLRQQGLRGVNLTVPHKEAACAIVDRMDDAARRIGAINLVLAGDDGILEGRNTDAYGFSENLGASGFRNNGGVAVVLGAGGAARAVVVALIDMGFEDIRIVNRTLGRAEAIARQFTAPGCKIAAVAWREAPQAMRDCALLVNTTSLGMAGQPALKLDLENLPSSATVSDIVYTPLETGLLRQAQQRGYAVVDGIGMLLHQARPSFHAFFGRDPEVTPALRAYVLEARK